jgi:CRP/FNR family transcriptional regulator, cyclic AMP receptor protein
MGGSESMAGKKDAPLDLRTYLAKARGGTTKDYRKKATIFSQGSPADAVFYIEKGKVKLTVLSTRGKEAVVGILNSGDFFGEGSLAGQLRRMATATTMTECSVLRIQKETMTRMLHNEPALSELFMSYLLSRNIRIEEDLVDQLFNSSEKRLARILLLLTRYGKDGQHELVVPRISQETLAEMVGTTRVQSEFLHEQVSEAGLHRL